MTKQEIYGMLEKILKLLVDGLECPLMKCDIDPWINLGSSCDDKCDGTSTTIKSCWLEYLREG